MLNNYQMQDNSNITDGNLGIYIDNQNQMEFHRVEVPYAFKLLLQEMQGLGINLRIRAERIKLALSKGVIDEESIDEIMDEIDGELMEDMEEFEDGELKGDELYEVMIDSQFDEKININKPDEDEENNEQKGGNAASEHDINDETTGEPLISGQNGGSEPREEIVEMPDIEFKDGAIDNELNTSAQYGGMHNISINPDLGNKDNDVNINIQKGGVVPAEFQTSGLMQPSRSGPPNLNPDMRPTGNNSGLNININTGNTHSGGGEVPKNDEIKTIAIEGGSFNEFGGFKDIGKKNKSKFTDSNNGVKNIEFGGGKSNKDVSLVTKQDAIYSIDPMLNIDNESL